LRDHRDRLSQQAAALQKTIESEQARNNESAAQVKSFAGTVSASKTKVEKDRLVNLPDNKTNVSPEQNVGPARMIRGSAIRLRRLAFLSSPFIGRRSRFGRSGNRFTIPKAQRANLFKA
jgi:hypothetical protein